MKRCIIVIVAKDKEDLFLLLNSRFVKNPISRNLKEVFSVTKLGHTFVKIEDSNEEDMIMLTLLEKDE